MIQPGGFSILDLMNPAEVLYKIVNKANDLSNKVSIDDVINNNKHLIFLENFFPDFESILGTRKTLINNEIKDIIKVIKPLENGEILLNGTTKKITSQEGVLLNFIKLLMTAGLSLIKSVLTSLAKSILIPLGLTVAASNNRCRY